MNSGSPRVRTVWRGIALVFAAAVVIFRLGIAGCTHSASSPAFVGPTKAGGGFRPLEQEQQPQAAREPTPSRPDAATKREEDDLSDPAYFPATKSGGGFYPRPSRAAQQQQAGGNQ